MQLRELHIDGFGIFADKHITGFRPGINVIYGSNEFGKTTLLAFIRRMLFGFPSGREKANPYPSLSGNAYGGRMVCELRSGEVVVVSRRGGGRGGEVSVTTESGEVKGYEELDRILGHTSKRFYENVYAISLDELQQIETLQGEDVKHRIYGAGLGLGNVSLTDIKGKFSRRAEDLYKARGSAQKIPQVYNEIRELERNIRQMQQELADYDEKVRQRDNLAAEEEQLGQKLRNLYAKQRSLQNKSKLFSTYINLTQAQSELSGLEEVPDFPEDALTNLESKKEKLSSLEDEIEGIERELKDEERKRENITYNQELLDKEPSIVSLQKSSQAYRDASTSIIETTRKRDEAQQSIEKEIAQIGPEWTEEKIRQFNLTHGETDTIDQYRSRLDNAQENVRNARNKLEWHREQKLTNASKGLEGPALHKFIFYFITALGLAGTVLGGFLSQWIMAGISAIFMVAGALALITLWKGSKPIVKDRMEEDLESRLNQAELEHRNLEEEWRSFLQDKGPDENLSPQGTLELVRAINDVQSRLSSLNDLNRQIQEMQNRLDHVKRLHDEVAPCLQEHLGDDIVRNIEVFTQRLNEAKDAKRNKERAEERINELKSRIEDLTEKRDRYRKDVQEYISSMGAVDEEDFRRKFEVFKKRKELHQRKEEARRIIQSTVGSGSDYESFIQSISETNPENIELELIAVNEEIESLESDRKQKNQEIGNLNNEIERLSSNEELLKKQGEVEERKQQLHEYSREWIRAQIPLFTIDKAIAKYENTRQPSVIKAAEGAFRDITGQMYSSIIKPIDSDELRIRDNWDAAKGVAEMSRGTKEQLYLAMRLGLIEEYERRSEPMPVVIDDVLVNFDDKRGLLAAGALQKFSEGRQIIVLTCHNNILDSYRKLGANEVVLE
ncbi:MAG: ATP-binding protein [Dehalococcoidia bacterium]